MRMTKQNFTVIELSASERLAMQIAEEVFRKIQTDINEGAVLINQSTGQVMPVEEIGMLRGYLSYFDSYENIVKIEQKGVDF